MYRIPTTKEYGQIIYHSKELGETSRMTPKLFGACNFGLRYRAKNGQKIFNEFMTKILNLSLFLACLRPDKSSINLFYHFI